MKKVCVVSLDVLNRISERIASKDEFAAISLLNECMGQARPMSDWIEQVEREQDVDRLCTLAAGIIANSMKHAKSELDVMYAKDIAESSALLLEQLKALVK